MSESCTPKSDHIFLKQHSDWSFHELEQEIHAKMLRPQVEMSCFLCFKKYF